MESKKIFFETSDGVQIAANWRQSSDNPFALILLHMMPATKESWTAFESKLSQAGIASLALDFRGHGESTKKFQISDVRFQNVKKSNTLDYKKFTDEEHQAKIKDIEGAVSWLATREIFLENIVLVGASIGANLAIQFLAEHPDLPAAAALSPGLDYRGIVTIPLARSLQRRQNLFLAASDDDPESYKAVQKLNEISLAKTTLALLKGAGHGTIMLDKDPVFMGELVKWIKDTIKEYLIPKPE